VVNDDPASTLAHFDLNDEQRRAAVLENQNVLVLAGAGTGKTRTIVARIAHLIGMGVDPRHIAALTFTRASANELSGRVAMLVGVRSNGLVSTTFHGWAMRLIRSHPEVFGYEGWNVIDSDDQNSLMGMIRGRKTKGSFPAASEMIDAFSYSRNTGSALHESIVKRLPDYEPIVEQIVECARLYSSRKQERHLLDFDDILVILAATLEKRPDVADWVGQNVHHLLVDEMQDTNPLQWRIIDQLVGRTKLFAVGDDAQSIYGFRGADFASIHSFSSRVEGTEVVRLEQNYRSTQEILDLPNWLLATSPLKYDKHLHAVRGSGAQPEVHEFDDRFSEAAWVADDILAQHVEGRSWADHLALVRTNFRGRALESAFLQRQIPYRFLGGPKLLESAHIRDVLSLLRVIANPRDDLAWMRLLQLLPGVGDVKATRACDSLLTAIDGGEPVDVARERIMSPLLGERILTCMARIETNLEAVAQAVVDALEALEPLLAERYAKSNWRARLGDFEPLARLAGSEGSISEFLSEYIIDPVYVTSVSGGSRDDAVTISTVHSAKGLEAPRAYVIDVTPGTYPWSHAENEDDVEEERRVLYVALTRAMDYLAITRTTARSNYASFEAMPDQGYFLADLPKGLVDFVSTHTQQEMTPFAGSSPQEVDLGFDP
jgi:DNA helicase-2/ATP-dependent DNA helicase PcrA